MFNCGRFCGYYEGTYSATELTEQLKTSMIYAPLYSLLFFRVNDHGAGSANENHHWRYQAVLMRRLPNCL